MSTETILISQIAELRREIDKLKARTSPVSYVTAADGTIHRRSVQTKVSETWNLTDFPGVDATGTTDSSAGFMLAIAAVAAAGGGTLVAPGSSATFLLSSNVDITQSHITLDGRGATISGVSRGRFRFTGRPSSNIGGDRSEVVRDCHVRNWHFGTDPTDVTQIVKGPQFSWCEDCTGENLVKKSRSGTGFNIDFSRRCMFRNCVCEGLMRSGAFAFLMWHNDFCIFDNCHALNSAYVYCYQVKGGYGNIICNCTCQNITQGDSSKPPVLGFRDRGDAPWKASASRYKDYTYPYETGSFETADIQRASRNTTFQNCHVMNSDIVAFSVQEAIGTRIIDCSAVNVKAALRITRVISEGEARASETMASGTSTLKFFMELDDEDEPIPVFLSGDTIFVTLDTGVLFSTTLASTPVAVPLGYEATLTAPLPSDVSAGNKIGRASPGKEADFVVRNFTVHGTTTADAISIESNNAASYLPGVKMETIIVHDAWKHGIAAKWTDGLIIKNASVYNPAQIYLEDPSENHNGISISQSSNTLIEGCEAIDDQDTPTMNLGITVGEDGSINPTVRDCRASGARTYGFKLWLPGTYAGNIPAEATVQTSGTTLADPLWRCTLLPGQTVRIEVTAIGNQDDLSNSGVIRISGVFTCSSLGVTTQVDSTTAIESTMTAVADAGGWAASFAVVSPVVRYRVRGGAGQTVNWIIQPRVTVIH